VDKNVILTKIIFISSLVHNGDKNKIYNKLRLYRTLLGMRCCKIRNICNGSECTSDKKAVHRRLQKSSAASDHLLVGGI
jgi:hypothetical protein